MRHILLTFIVVQNIVFPFLDSVGVLVPTRHLRGILMFVLNRCAKPFF